MRNKYTFWVILSLIVVFLAGITGGIFLSKFVIEKKPKWVRAEKDGRRRPHSSSLEIMATELALTTEQQEKIKEIFKNNEEKFKKIKVYVREQLSTMRSFLKKEIENVLDKEQKKKLDSMIKKFEADRRKSRRKRKAPHPRATKEKGERK